MEFLRQIVDDLAKQKIEFGEIAIVTPNRRAGLFIKKYIQENNCIKKPFLQQLDTLIERSTKVCLKLEYLLYYVLYHTSTHLEFLEPVVMKP